MKDMFVDGGAGGRLAALAGALIATLLAAGCAAIQGPSAELASCSAAGFEAEPETLLPPPSDGLPLLAATRAPEYSAASIPSRPQAIGRLDVPLTRQWRYVVIHHSATASGNEEIFDRYHREQRGWDGVGYHFVIGNGHGSADGAIEVTFRWEQQWPGAHAGVAEYNQYGIGICLVGDFEQGFPAQAQIASLVALTNYLQERCRIPTSRVLLHRHLKNTNCPGANFPFYEFISLLDH